MPLQPEAGAVEPLMEAVDGAVWVHYDRQHRLLFVGRESRKEGYTVHSYDIVTGQPHDQSWPLGEDIVILLGLSRAFAGAVAERVNRGY